MTAKVVAAGSMVLAVTFWPRTVTVLAAETVAL
jgi:hypothetical protein